MKKKFHSLTVAFLVIAFSVVFVLTASNISANASSSYDAKIVNQTKRRDNIYSSCPGSSTRGVGVNFSARSYNNHYVRVISTRKTKAGTFCYVRYYSTYLGWIRVGGLKKSSISAVASSAMARYDLTGSVLLNYAGPGHQAVLARGYANKAKKIRNTAENKEAYPLASVQKVMTGAMIQQLIASKKLSPYTRLSRFYPHIRYSSYITIQRMLSMTSGIVSTSGYWPSHVLSESKAFSNIQHHINSTGSNGFNYSDANFVLLAGIITKVTHKSYAQNLKSRILKPMHMNNTFIAGEKTGKEIIPISYKQSGYHGAKRLSMAHESTIVGAGNVYSSVQDFAASEKEISGGKILTWHQYKSLLSYGSYYSGGNYVNIPGIKHSHGTFGGTGFSADMYGDLNNYHLAVVFTNSPLKNHYDNKQFVITMYTIAKYY